jgi:hypothetical protein
LFVKQLSKSFAVQCPPESTIQFAEFIENVMVNPLN